MSFEQSKKRQREEEATEKPKAKEPKILDSGEDDCVEYTHEPDDEGTLAEEEELEKLAGIDHEEEIGDLKAEADIPLEDLLPPGYVSISSQIASLNPKSKKQKKSSREKENAR
eukprot:354077_1